MATETPHKVPFDSAVVRQCLCPSCPVQAKSNCVAGLKQNLSAALAHNPLDKKEIPGVYCSSGKATCTDINPAQRCICFNCSVYMQYNLKQSKPDGWYCRDGEPR